ncbi:hypothetical protein DVT68_00170 [Dyella solisilvae]|uniref:Uncharacterized protein n=1 Tax=Dyella solisilvae TaxID=1920168 RepID=A0A370KA59_9GAMM|nr:hypothetical protein [Dyella solisilvae]RDI99317.1 hypothetical protein DVT68_00170 [Dyella solisilvae]
MNPAGARKAALSLAAMHSRDRRWMLSHLPHRQRRVLAMLVREVRRLSALDPNVLQTALSSVRADTPLVEVPPPDQLVRALNEVPAAWAARTLAAAAIDHVDVYLASCDPLRAMHVKRELERLPSLMPVALARALSRRLAETGGEPGEVP